ncbi:unnamed protein product [Scytosiphon promiscuus]
MALFRAFLVGDVASLIFLADSRSPDGVDDSEGKDIGHILRRSFGKVIKVPSAPPSQCHQQPATPTETRSQRCLQLSLEEAFYLAHVDGCLGLEIGRVGPVGPWPPVVLSSPPPRHPGDLDEQSQPEGVIGKVGDSRGDEMFRADADRFGGGGDFAGIENLNGCDDFGPLMSSEEAWRYCCDRRPDFPAMFAVYQHFRRRRYTVHTGHKYGAHFVLYEGSPDECHSRYCVHVMGAGGGGRSAGGDSWGHMKTVTRLMPDVAKCLLVCGVTYDLPRPQSEAGSPAGTDTSSLAALAAAEVTALRFSRSREPDKGGGAGGRGGGGGSRGKGARRGEGATVLKVRPAATSTSSPRRKSAKQEKEKVIA